MITYSKVIELSDSEPVTLEEAKSHLEVQGTSKDDYITVLIKVARKACENYAGLSFITQTRRVTLDHFPGCGHWQTSAKEIILPYGPVQSIESFTYAASDKTEQTINEGDDGYLLDDHSGLARVVPMSGGEIGSWPSTAVRPNAVVIDYVCGYDSVSGDTDFPTEAIQAILLQVGTMFENRQDEVIGTTVTELNTNSRALLDNIKVYWNANQY